MMSPFRKFFLLIAFSTAFSVIFMLSFNRHVNQRTHSPDEVKEDYEFYNILNNTHNSPMLTNRHVIGRMLMSGGRLGNEMFVFASVLGIAEANGMIPVYHSLRLREVFNVSSEITNPDSKSVTWSSTAVGEYSPCKYDRRFNSLHSDYTNDVMVVGFFQSWKYFRSIRSRVISEFTFLNRHRNPAAAFLQNVRAEHGLDNNAVFIGVQIRRGDFLADYNIIKGYTVADQSYLERAVLHLLRQLHQRHQQSPLTVVYIVCTDDRLWSRKHFPNAILRAQLERAENEKRSVFHSVKTRISRMFNYDETVTQDPSLPEVKEIVVFSPGATTEQDLAMLSMCNHTIMTVGTFSWWAGYLAGGMTVYYKNFPSPASPFEKTFSAKDFFPPDWIGL